MQFDMVPWRAWVHGAECSSFFQPIYGSMSMDRSSVLYIQFNHMTEHVVKRYKNSGMNKICIVYDFKKTWKKEDDERRLHQQFFLQVDRKSLRTITLSSLKLRSILRRGCGSVVFCKVSQEIPAHRGFWYSMLGRMYRTSADVEMHYVRDGELNDR